MEHSENIIGLTSVEAAFRLQNEGSNALPAQKKRNVLVIALEALREPMFVLLLCAASLYLLIGEFHEGFFLLLMVLLTLGLTLYQENKAERALEALQAMSTPQALAIRDGRPQYVDSKTLVRGDVLVLSEGDRIAADGILMTGPGLQVDESLLTGEAVPVYKTTKKNSEIFSSHMNVSSSTLFAGTLVVQGDGAAEITKTGAQSEMGRIGSKLNDITPESSLLQKQISKLIKTFALLGIALSTLLTIVQGLFHGEWLQGLLAGIALAMSMMPEEFAVILAVFPALGAWRLAQAKVLTRRLSAIETLGTTSVLCTDKTGTLTENKMKVARLYIDNEEIDIEQLAVTRLPEIFHSCLNISVLASRAVPFDPMEKAFYSAREKFVPPANSQDQRKMVHEYVLTPGLRVMSQCWKNSDQKTYFIASKGAPEEIVAICKLEKLHQQRILAAADRMAADGLRVLGVASAIFEGDVWPNDQRSFQFTFSGLIGLVDPLREDIPDAIEKCRTAGIRVIMITGDYPLTAMTIARHAGLQEGIVLTGDMMALLDDAQLVERIETTTVCARITPEQKLRIVQALKAAGEVVAMTGDGVNDAPALKAAHVGIAMGKRGTQVAREAASLVLLDDSFTSIVRAIRIGRTIFGNMRRAMTYLVSIHVPIAGMALAPLLLGWPIMLYPMHIVFLELIIDPTCSLVFENEEPDESIMNSPPRNPGVPLFTNSALLMALLEGLGVLIVVALVYSLALDNMSESGARAFAFTALITANLMLMISNRSLKNGITAMLRKHNSIMWGVIVGSVSLLFFVIQYPLLQNIFYFSSLSLSSMLIAITIGFASVIWHLPLKWYKAQKNY
ncbi:cation-translocating P-type ATPase [Herminiimonas fonticola]|uniref:Ca2+-transporting ATPase n=1 Tax=Herminiimonas fonticola TaxID=303380 RepID=A0A4V6PRE9_9BURK|nr:cation-translocating P-type ATPase [Herminiimonas fonticola]RBA23622.1 HAD ATPase, P-type, family IC [Herminiimonas fonticola]TDN88028.1 Ca2+-transporting ATPase [Herminiimonas fonticola]